MADIDIDALISQIGLANPSPSLVKSPPAQRQAQPRLESDMDALIGKLGISAAPQQAAVRVGPGAGASSGPGACSGPGAGLSSGPGAAATAQWRQRQQQQLQQQQQPQEAPALSYGPGQAGALAAAAAAAGGVSEEICLDGEEGPPCHSCGRPICGSVFTVDDKMFHPECFTCFHCGQRIDEDASFMERDGHIYCEHDFTDLFTPRCFTCQKPVTDQIIRFQERVYHPEHFACADCGTKLRGQKYVEDENEPVCLACKTNRMKNQVARKGEICARCKKPIVGEFIVLKGQKIHPEHYRCEDCGADFIGGNCREFDNAYYCEDCYKKKLLSTCGRCRKPIAGRSVTALGRVFHPECFTCAVCNQPFPNSKFFEMEGKAYCEFHYQKLFGKPCAKCGKQVFKEGIDVCGKTYHPDCFVCSGCNGALNQKKMYSWEGKPMCKACYDKLPKEIRKKIDEQRKAEDKAEKERKKAEKEAEKLAAKEAKKKS
eukprot:TRINITY_DN5418_c0_g1_i1.p1 TRINITY_DN5418_c0_g1~~TRINITY_DN5418_c0_g1_i1.p1  ORF type:complete len:496 (-),score=140.39 TRINITY_DN5418_c0_g1_i1:83-1540(-)